MFAWTKFLETADRFSLNKKQERGLMGDYPYADLAFDYVDILLKNAKTTNLFYLDESFILESEKQYPDFVPPEKIRYLDLPFKSVCLMTKRSLAPRHPDIIPAFFAYEIEPGNYAVLDLVKKGNEFVLGQVLPNRPETQSAYALLNFLFSQMRSSRFAEERVNERVKVGPKRGREIIKVNRIVRVVPKKTKTIQPLFGGSVEWLHHWEVMGHFRQVSGLGKDRNGDYTIPGATWVIPHYRGDKSKPLVRKTRVVVKA